MRHKLPIFNKSFSRLIVPDVFTKSPLVHSWGKAIFFLWGDRNSHKVAGAASSHPWETMATLLPFFAFQPYKAVSPALHRVLAGDSVSLPKDENMKCQAKIISIIISEGDDGLYHVTSPQLGSLFVTGETMEQAVDKVPESIEGLYALDGVKVCAVPADSQDLPIPDPWVILEGGRFEAAC